MNLIGSEFLKRLRRKESSKPDFSHYHSALKKIAPLSYRLLGNEYLENAIPKYLQEIIINPESIEETIFYFPLFLKKLKPEESYLVELMDYEFVCYQASLEPAPNKNSAELATHIYLNPFCYALRLEFDIHEYAQRLRKNLSEKPKAKKNLLLIAKDTNNELAFLDAQMLHAAIMDELHDGKVLKRDCLELVQKQLPHIPQRDWILALQDLKSVHVVLETSN